MRADVLNRNSARAPSALVGGLVAALVVVGSTLLLRWTLQVRSVPERLVEWLLLFVPPSLFEAVLQWLGFDAKRYALYLAVVEHRTCLQISGERDQIRLTKAHADLGRLQGAIVCLDELTAAQQALRSR